MIDSDRKTKTMQRSRVLVAAVSIGIFLLFFSTGFGLLIRENLYSSAKPADRFALGDLEKVMYSVDRLDEENRSLLVRGWLVKPGEAREYYNFGMDYQFTAVYNHLTVALQVGDIVYLLPTRTEKRADVTAYLNDGIDYGHCGFEASIPLEHADHLVGGSLVLIREDTDGHREMYALNRRWEREQGEE